MVLQIAVCTIIQSRNPNKNLLHINDSQLIDSTYEKYF